jgi:hydroxyacylglutathione hydrolase
VNGIKDALVFFFDRRSPPDTRQIAGGRSPPCILSHDSKRHQPLGEPMQPFTARSVAGTTWVVEGLGCNSYLVAGAEKAVMVDTGMSTENLRLFVETLTSLPISVVNTHGHFDHTGGNGWFDACYMHANAVRDAKAPFANAKEYPLQYRIDTIADGHIFDLGGRTLEVIEIPAHSPGSVALLDRATRLLFSGDELDPDQVLMINLDGKGSTVERHLRNMLKLKERAGEFDVICPGHNATPIDKGYLDEFIANDRRVVDGVEGSRDIFSPTFNWGLPEGVREFTRRSTFGRSAIVYDARKIREG